MHHGALHVDGDAGFQCVASIIKLMHYGTLHVSFDEIAGLRCVASIINVMSSKRSGLQNVESGEALLALFSCPGVQIRVLVQQMFCLCDIVLCSRHTRGCDTSQAFLEETQAATLCMSSGWSRALTASRQLRLDALT